jgi:hypothetical protein
MMILIMAETGTPGFDAMDSKSDAQRAAENDRAHNIAETVIAKRTASTAAKVDSGTPFEYLPPGEQALLSADLIRSGEASNIAINTMNADGSDDIVVTRGSDIFTVTAITGTENDPDGKPVYVCKTAGGSVERIPIDNLLAAHGDKNADAMFPDQDQAKLYKWHTKGDKSDSPVDSALIEAMDIDDRSEFDGTLLDLNHFINQQIDSIQDELKQLHESNQSPDREQQLMSLLRECKVAMISEGVAGIRVKEDLLKMGLRRHLKSTAGTVAEDAVDQLDQHLQKLNSSGLLLSADQAIVDFLHQNTQLEDAQYKELAQRVQKGEALAVLRDPKVAELPGVNELVFGDSEMTSAIVDNLVGNPSIDAATREKLSKLKTAGKITGVSLLVILLGIPAAAVVGAFEAASAAAGMGGRR